MFTPEEIDFITKHQNDDINALRIKYSSKNELNYTLLINHIEAKRKAKLKLPELSSTDNFIFPPTSNLEQSSSEITAKYKTGLCKGKSGIDLTGGFGIDTIYMSESFENYAYVEPNQYLFKISKGNFDSLKLNIDYFNTTSEDFLQNNTSSFDVIYLDPSRRNNDGKKVVFIEDYSPNLLEIKDILLERSNKIIVKTSPILDISDTIRKLEHVAEVHIISIKNEVKEVLYILNKSILQLIYKTVNFKSESIKQTFDFTEHELHNSISEFSLPLKYIYEPNSSIMKSGAFNFISSNFKIKKLHKNSHLYTSDVLINDFPGRVFWLNNIHKYNKKELSSYSKANITTRNFPHSVSEIRKKTKIKDGGNIYLFGTTDINNKTVILACEKIEN